MPGLLLAHVLAHLSLGGDCRRVAVRSAIAGGRSNRVTTPWALNTISLDCSDERFRFLARSDYTEPRRARRRRQVPMR
jgi:hypothetical protein